jgi:hypothetical protein
MKTNPSATGVVPLFERVAGFLSQAAWLFGGVSVVVGTAWGLLLFYKANMDDHVKITLAFYDKFNASPYTTYRESIDKLNDLHDVELQKAAAGDEETYQNKLVELLNKSDTGYGLDLITDFFDGVSACVEAKLCDRNVAFKLFQPRAEELYNEFFPYMKYESTHNGPTNYGLGVQEIAHLTPRKETFIEHLLAVFN